MQYKLDASVPANQAVDDETTDLLRQAQIPRCHCKSMPEPLAGFKLSLDGMSQYWSEHWPWSADVRENIELPLLHSSCLPREGR